MNDIKNVFKLHYNGTEHDPYLNKNPKEPYRPISIFRITQIHILQVRPKLPREIGRINYVALGMGSLCLFLPYYAGIKTLPPSYNTGDNTCSDDSVYWQHRKIQTLAMVNYNAYAPIVQQVYEQFENELAQRQKEMETDYLNCYKSQPLKAIDIVQAFSDKMIADVEKLNINLTNKLFTILTRDIQTEYLFRVAKKPIV